MRLAWPAPRSCAHPLQPLKPDSCSPAAAVTYAPLTLANRKTSQFCYDIATLQPVYNPLATFIAPNASGIAASPASTVAVFGQAYGAAPAATCLTVLACAAP